MKIVETELRSGQAGHGHGDDVDDDDDDVARWTVVVVALGDDNVDGAREGACGGTSLRIKSPLLAMGD